jgi:hypothetical protein
LSSPRPSAGTLDARTRAAPSTLETEVARTASGARPSGVFTAGAVGAVAGSSAAGASRSNRQRATVSAKEDERTREGARSNISPTPARQLCSRPR